MNSALLAGSVMVVGLLALPALGQDSEALREDDMFGGDTGAPPAETSASASTPTPAGVSPSGETPGLLQSEQQALAVGGQLFLRLNGSLSEDQGVGDVPLSSPSLIDVFADVRPTDRIRGFAQVRLTYDFTVTEGETTTFGQQQKQFEMLLDQMWVKFDLGRVAFVTAGRQRIRWGTGRFWNPTDFINQDIRNSVDFFDQRLGMNLLKVHFPFEQLGWNLYLLGTFDGVDIMSDTGVGARAEFLFAQTELALSTLVKKDTPLRLGIDASSGIWIFDVRGEATVQRGLQQKRYEGELDFETGKVPTEVDTDGEWFFQGVFGADATVKITDQDNLILGGEYFYNQAGYASAELYPFLALNGAFTPLYLGQHYVAAYAVAQGPLSFNDTNLTLSTIANLSDKSVLSRLDVQQQVLTYLTVNVFTSAHWGSPGELKLGLEVPPIPLVLPEGLKVPTQILDFGVAMRVSL